MKNDRKSISDRHLNILNMVRENGDVKVEDIAREFGISEMTVRRDLQLLSEKNLLLRVHGGAVSLANVRSASDPTRELSVSRDSISAYAAMLVKNGDTIFINGSLTALRLLDYIQDREVDVYTNNGYALGRKYARGIRVRLTGGEIRGHILIGDSVMRTLLELTADKTFIGCAAVYDDGEFRYDIPTEIGINEAMITRTEGELYILADHTKLQKKANQVHSYGACIYDYPSTLVTDEMADPEIVQSLRSLGMQVVTVPLNKMEEMGKDRL